MIRLLMRYILVLLGLHHMVQTIERPTGKTKSQTILTWREASAKQWRTSERKTEGHFSSGVPQHAWQRIQHRTNYKSSKDQTTSSSDSLVVELKHFFACFKVSTATNYQQPGTCCSLHLLHWWCQEGASCCRPQEAAGPDRNPEDLLTLYTQTAHQPTPQPEMFKTVDETTLVGLIQNSNQSAYKGEVSKLSQCSFSTGLTLNTSETKEMIISFRKQKEEPAPIHRKRRSGEGDQL